MPSHSKHFEQLVASNHPIGEVVGVDKFIVKVKGLQPVNTHALILFQDGSKGYVHHILHEYVVVMHLGTNPLPIGALAVVQYEELVTKVGKDFIGRVVSVTGEPLDSKGPIASENVWPIFSEAPGLADRQLLDQQLETGVTVIDALFPILRGQRMAMLGDSKSGKSALATQVALHQKDSDIVVIYALIAKRRSDVDSLIARLNESGAMNKTIVVVSTVNESLTKTYLAPYVACALGEYLWQKEGQDTLVIYDDLMSHAQAYREISLLAGSNPGRDSFPGDMFYAHSSLLERGGRLASNHGSQTTISLVLANGGDITAYLPTNIMSITDGQWILDMEVFRNILRPALSLGLSVTRVGGRGHSPRQRQLAAQIQTSLAQYNQASEYAHFGSELALNAQQEMTKGLRVYEIFNQKPEVTFSLMAQQLMLDIALTAAEDHVIDTDKMKEEAVKLAAHIKDDQDYEKAKTDLTQMVVTKHIQTGATQ